MLPFTERRSLNSPLSKREAQFPPFEKGGEGGFTYYNDLVPSLFQVEPINYDPAYRRSCYAGEDRILLEIYLLDKAPHSISKGPDGQGKAFLSWLMGIACHTILT